MVAMVAMIAVSRIDGVSGETHLDGWLFLMAWVAQCTVLMLVIFGDLPPRRPRCLAPVPAPNATARAPFYCSQPQTLYDLPLGIEVGKAPSHLRVLWNASQGNGEVRELATNMLTGLALFDDDVRAFVKKMMGLGFLDEPKDPAGMGGNWEGTF